MKKIALVSALVMAMCQSIFAQQQPIRVPYLPHTPSVVDSDVFVCNKNDSNHVDSSQATCIVYAKDLRTYIHAPHTSTHTSGQLMLWGTSDTAKGLTVHWADTGVVNIQYTEPVTGNTVTSNGRRRLIVNPGGTLSTLTIVFPASPSNGQVFAVDISKIITTLTLSAPGKTINGSITTSAVNSYGEWTYVSAVSTWFLNYAK